MEFLDQRPENVSIERKERQRVIFVDKNVIDAFRMILRGMLLFLPAIQTLITSPLYPLFIIRKVTYQ